jgi:hypothetical protein
MSAKKGQRGESKQNICSDQHESRRPPPVSAARYQREGNYLALEVMSYSTEDVFVTPRPRVDEERRFWGEQRHQGNQAESGIALRYNAKSESQIYAWNKRGCTFVGTSVVDSKHAVSR